MTSPVPGEAVQGACRRLEAHSRMHPFNMNKYCWQDYYLNIARRDMAIQDTLGKTFPTEIAAKIHSFLSTWQTEHELYGKYKK